MVLVRMPLLSDWMPLSVLALSSRFDGQFNKDHPENHRSAFSTRSVESF